jgi:membrane protease YdiL (CAAX protease family)
MNEPTEEPGNIAPQTPGRWPVILGLSFEGGLALLSWLLGWPLGVLPWTTLHWKDPRASAFGVAITVPMLGAFFLLLRSNLPQLLRIRRLFEESFRPFFAAYTVLDLAALSLLAGIGEEMLFRGVLQALFSRWLDSRWLGLAMASLIFGLLHAVTPTYLLLATLAGAYLGLMWLLSGNLLTVIIAHSLYDFVALVYLVRFATPNRP